VVPKHSAVRAEVIGRTCRWPVVVELVILFDGWFCILRTDVATLERVRGRDSTSTLP